jgi:hypothetical protein
MPCVVAEAQQDPGDCYVVERPSVVCVGEDEGVWRMTLRLGNRSGFPIDRLFVWPSGDAVVSPTGFSLEPVPSGGSTGELEFVITGGQSGDQLCVLVSAHDSMTGQCCAEFETCVVLPACRQEPEFRRGDANGDGGTDISDGIRILGVLFLGLPQSECLDASDANDSGEVDISDGIAIFSYLFLGGLTPPAPGPDLCGPDPSADALSCGEYSTCT